MARSHDPLFARLTLGDWIVAAGAGALAVCVNLPWYSLNTLERSGWDYVPSGLLPLGLAGLMLVVIGFRRACPERLPDLGEIRWDQVVALVGVAAAVLVGVRLWFADTGVLVFPDGRFLAFTLERRFGCWCALGAAVVVAAGGVLRLGEARRARRAPTVA